MSVKNVLVIGLFEPIGGLEKTTIDLCLKAEKERDTNFIFLIPDGCRELEKYIRRNNLKSITIISWKKNMIKYCLNLFRIIKLYKVDGIYYNMTSAGNILPIIIARILKINKIVLHSHNSGAKHGALKRTICGINKVFFCLASDLLACSEESGSWLYGKKRNFKIVQNPINVREFVFSKTARREIRSKYGIYDEDLLLGCVGRFSVEKNQSFLLHVLRNLPETSKIKIIMIGPGDKVKIALEAQKLKVNNMVIFEEYKENIGEYMSALDALLAPSLKEGFGNAVIEAQINGAPVLASTGFPDGVKKGDNIKFIPLKNTKEWEGEILRLKPRNIDEKTDNVVPTLLMDDIKRTTEIFTSIWA